MIYIKKVMLCNWHQYQGDYNSNVIPFESGLNIFCGDNNAGKTKIHNAFRWVLQDQVILPGSIRPCQITKSSLEEVVNDEYFKSIGFGEDFCFGVDIEFVKGKRANERRFRVRKEVKGRKEKDWEVVQKVLVPSNGNAWRTTSAADDSFEVRSQFIHKLFQPYLFLQGEVVQRLIPFSGRELRDAIENITGINEIDPLIERANLIQRTIQDLRDTQVKNQAKADDAVSKAVSDKQELEKRKRDLDAALEANRQKQDDFEKAKEEIRQEATQEKEVRGNLESLVKLESKSKSLLDHVESLERSYYGLISAKFKISSFLRFDANFVHHDFRELISQIKAKRMASLTPQVDEETEAMIARLIHNQPGIDVLEDIVRLNRCFVCGTNPIGSKSVDYIENKLIPHFKSTPEKSDPTVLLLGAVEQLVNEGQKGLTLYSSDQKVFSAKIDEIALARQDYLNSNQDIQDFLQKNGNPRSSQGQRDILERFNEISQQLHSLKEDEKDDFRELGEVKAKIDAAEQIIARQAHQMGGSLHKYEEALRFQGRLLDNLKSHKERAYSEFCEKLAELSTKRLHRYFGDNTNIKDSKFQVNLEVGSLGTFEFKIDVVKKNGQVDPAPGGAETAMRQYCVVFSLLELSRDYGQSASQYPLIVDAPISELNSGYRLSFYRNLLNEKFNSQIIVLTYDLATPTPSRVNEAGIAVYEAMEKAKSEQMVGNFLFKKDKASKVLIFNGKNE